MVDLTAEQILALKERFGSMHAAAVAALQDELFADEFGSIGAELMTLRDGSLTFALSFEHHEEFFWRLVWATHQGRGNLAAKRGAKELGIPEREFWWILERRLENGGKASRKWLALQTKERQDLTYVPRDRLSPFVDWIDAHPEAAREMRSLRRIPPEFRAGERGPIPPSA